MIMTSSPGTLATIGYMEPEARGRIDAFVARPYAYLIDIRLTPYSRWHPEWNRPALQARYGRRYGYWRGLGNVHHRERNKPIHLLDPERHIQHLSEELLRGRSYLLLCACKNYAHCHRKVVYEQVLLALGGYHPEETKAPAGTVYALSLWG
jgi:hypothetical protein